VGFDVLTTCQPSTVWCRRERLPAAAAQPAKVRQNCSATDYYIMVFVYSSLISIEVIYGEEIKENTLGQFQQNADKG
jgi:hypothetical protein